MKKNKRTNFAASVYHRLITLATTQIKERKKFEKAHGRDARERLLRRLSSEIGKRVRLKSFARRSNAISATSSWPISGRRSG